MSTLGHDISTGFPGCRQRGGSGCSRWRTAALWWTMQRKAYGERRRSVDHPSVGPRSPVHHAACRYSRVVAFNLFTLLKKKVAKVLGVSDSFFDLHCVSTLWVCSETLASFQTRVTCSGTCRIVLPPGPRAPISSLNIYSKWFKMKCISAVWLISTNTIPSHRSFSRLYGVSDRHTYLNTSSLLHMGALTVSWKATLDLESCK